MTLKELEKIANKYINSSQQSLPINALDVAFSLNIKVKNGVQAKIDFQGNSPLDTHNAIYTLYRGEYTIYYDEHYIYKNFAIAHEIAHHLLGHTSDGAAQHHDANLLAAVIIAPARLIYKHKIKSVHMLAEICKMPIDIAEVYWNEIKFNLPKPLKSIAIKFGCFAGGVVFGYIFSNLNSNKTHKNEGKQIKPPTKK